MVAVQTPRVLMTNFVQPASPKNLAAGELLPPSMNPVTDERLARCIDEAYRDMYQGKQFPTGQQRTELMNVARELRAQGRNAEDIRYALRDKIRLKTEGLDKPNDATLNRLIDEAFQRVYKGKHPPSASERNEMMDAARKMIADGKNGEFIKYGLIDKVRIKSEGLDKTDDATLNRLINEAFQRIYEGKHPPSAAERNEMMQEARKMVADGQSAETIKYGLIDKVRVKSQGLDKTDDATLNRLINEAFQRIYAGKHPPSASERNEMMQEARKMVADGKNAEFIKYGLIDKVRIKSEGLDKTDDATLNRLINEAFQRVYEGKHPPSAAERNEMMQEARKMVADSQSAETIKYGLIDKVRIKSQGLDKTDDPTLNRLIDEAYRRVLEGARPPSSRERTEWLKVARQMAADGQKAETIKYALADQLRIALDNR
ncbi:hypothetical protein [Vitiosangium sp. GDMCC 1.1324]|uniref:hypothetical protein n=1 Tax=Vitiosangium sp. (strain GDMCC 1.1324) TaxID=2138576 RepID=UPI000D3A2C08|nr:hypothetical protein [Vitiosangium sp. GDMCC 1.1324]PTL85397.1 hypothetical protein DAT35_01375 [Vitiosangium sp. GDMCC 1.1324]